MVTDGHWWSRPKIPRPWREPLSCPQSRQDRLSQTGACTFNAKWRRHQLTFWIFEYLWISLTLCYPLYPNIHSIGNITIVNSIPSGNFLHFAIEAMVIFHRGLTPTHGIGACVGHGQRGASLAVLGVHHVCTSVLHVPRKKVTPLRMRFLNGGQWPVEWW